MKLTNKKQINNCITLFMFTYLVSYLTRINFGAALTEIISDTGFPKTALSAAVTGSFITYGTGQVISGFFGDYIQPKKLVLLGLCTSCCMNLLIPLCNSPYHITVIWSINGFAQAFMWPPIVRLMVYLFSDEDYKRASYLVSMGAGIGTIAVYLLSPLLIITSSWRSIFYFSSLCGILMAVIWNRKCYTIEETKPKNTMKVIKSSENSEAPEEENKATDTKYQSNVTSAKTPISISTFLFPIIMVIIVLHGSLRDGVTTWMPSYISETYALGSAISILSGVVLPIFQILCSRFALTVYKRFPTEPLLCACIFFIAGSVATAALYFLTGHSALGSIFFSALLIGSMHGVNLMVACMVPPYFQKSGNVSLISGLLNACTYIGSAISTYGIAFISTHIGWNNTILIWLLISFTGGLLCFLCTPVWRQRFQL